jgi:oligopeptide/dipeptide ABC transporter ATP-binding protein
MLLLELEHLCVSYPTASGAIRAVRDLSLQVKAGESLALVGETGSGKSTAALALMGLLESNARIDAGEIRFEGVPLSFTDHRSWKHLRGNMIGMVFQDARGALNPVLTLGSQVIEALRAHQRLSAGTARETATALLAEVGIPDPAFYLHRYPIELSGGMCQRVAIAIAVCNRPRLLIADEPTSALDPSIQAQILELLRGMKQRHGLALLLISHDLALVAEVAERVAVMYHGRMVECGRASDVLRHPAHPYTSALVECQADLHHRWDRQPLAAIAGAPPAGGQEFPGCSFAPRCPRADAACNMSVPPPDKISGDHWAACFKPARDSRPNREAAEVE